MTRKLTMSAALVLALGFMTGAARAQQYGPPTSGSKAAIQFVPGTLNLVAGLNGLGYGGDGGPANSATTQLNGPTGVAYDTLGNLFIADGYNYIVRRVDHTTGDISTFAGTEGTEGFSANGGTALGAQFGQTSGLIIDASNNLYLSDSTNGVVWKITGAGGISIFAGGGSAPTSCTGSTNSIGDGCLATDAAMATPAGLAFDASGNLYIADTHDFIVREVTAATGKISTFAGVVGDSYFSGCPTALYSTSTGPYLPTQAHLCFPYGIGFDSNGNFYVAESQRYLVRIVTKSTGDISTFAGGGTGTCTGATSTFGDGCPATDAILHYPAGLYVDPANRVYFVDEEGGSIRMVDTSGTITTVFGGNGELTKGSIGEPDTMTILVNNSPVGSANGIDFFTLDIDGNIVATDVDSGAATSAGSSGGYYFPETEIFTTETTTEANAFSSAFPANIIISNPSGVPLTFIGTPVVTGPFGVVTGAGAGTCTFPGTVAPGKSCTVVLSFTPTAGGNTKFTGTVSIDSNANGSPSVINMQGLGDGTATTSATLTAMGGGDVLTFTSAINVQSATQQAVLTNTGQTPIAISSYQTTGVSAAYFGVTGTTCPVSPATLAVGDSCTLNVAFTPNAATTFTAGLQVCISTASYGCINGLNLDGTGTGVVTLTPSPVAFGNVPVGTTASPKVATLTNGNEPAFTSVTYSIVGMNPSDFAIVSGTNACTSTVDGDGGTCSIYVTFTPGSATSFQATLQAAGMANGSPLTVTVPLTGTGTGAPSDTLSVSSMDFYGQIVGTTSGTIAEKVSNPAVGQEGEITFSAITATPPFAIGTGANACSTTTPLQPDDVCYVYVTFTPGAMQAYTGNLTLTSNAMGSPQMVPLSGQGVIFNEPENLTQAMQTMNVYFTAYGETVDIYLLTQGGNYQDFTPDATAGSCHKGTSYNIGDSCTVNVDFSPYAPGAVSGAIVITDPNGNILAEEELPGTGTGPLVAFEPGVQSTVPAPTTESGYQAPLGVAVDVNGNVYVSDSVNNRVVEVQDGTTPVVLPATTPALNDPFGVALDGLGDVFVADTLNGRIVEWPWNAETRAYVTPVYIEGGLSEPAGVAIDGYGNLYVADEGHNEVFAFPVQPGGTYGTAVALPFTGLHFPKGVTVDGNNNVFVADTGDGNIDELPWTGSGYGTQATVVSGLIQPIAIAVDASGSLYTGDAYVGGVYQVPFNGTSYGTMNLLPFTGLQSSIAVAVDPFGDVYVCDGLNNDVQELDVQNEPVLNFATTAIGKTSTDSPKNATLTNIGNQPLNIENFGNDNPSYPSDFPVNSAAAGLCEGNTNVNPSASCVISVNFTPLVSGTLSETVSVTDNNYGESDNEDDITVNGTATGTVNTAPTLSPASLDFGGVQINTTSFPLSVEVTANSSSVSLAGSSITGTSAFALTTGANACTTSTTLTSSQSCYFYVSFTPTATTEPYAGTLNIGTTGLTVALSGQGISFGSNVGTLQPAQSVSVVITAAGTLNSIQVLTQGIPGLDFTLGSGGTCATGTAYTVGQTCTINVDFKPRFPGERFGAVQLYTSTAGSAPIGSTLLSGVGQGPMINFGIETSPGVFAPTSTTTLNFNAGTNVAVDPNHNLYVNAGNAILEATAASSYQTTNTIVAANGPNSLALDGAGDLIWTDYGSGQILEVTAVNGVIPANPTPVPLGSGWSVPWSSVVDAQGDVFVANTGNNPGLYEIVAINGAVSSSSTVQLIENTYTPLWMAFDSGGNLYFTGQYQHACVYEIPQVGGQILASTPSQQIVCGFGLPLSIAVDAAGNLWEADFYSGVSKVEAVNGVIPASPTIIDYSTYAFGLGLDANGNVFWTTYENGNYNTLIEYDFADPPSFTWSGQTNVGTTDSTVYTAYAVNDGNQPLVLSVPSTGDNPAIDVNWIWATGSTGACPSVAKGGTAADLAEGVQCELPISFAPQNGGTLTGDLTFTDNNLNVSGATQNIGLTGDGVGSSQPTATLTGIAFGSEVDGTTTAAMSATLTNTSATTALTISDVTITGTNAADFALATGANACGGSLAANTSCLIYATFKPSLVGPEAATLNVADNATGSPQTAPLTGTGTAPVVTATLTPISFGDEVEGTTTAAMTATLTNTSATASLTITSESITGANAADFAMTGGTGGCAATLAAGKSCLIYVTFKPSMAAAETATLDVADNATGSPTTALLTGTGTASSPTATLTSISFGNVTEGATSAAMSATLTDTSTTTALTISSITIGGTNGDDFSKATGTGACGATLAANTSCKIYATFTPSLVGAESAMLSVNDNATGSPQTAALTGTGTAPLVPVASLSPTTLPFGNQTVNTTSSAMTTTLSNTGTGVLTISGIFLNEPNEEDGVKGPRAAAITISSSPDYAATTTCGVTLAAGSTCTISVTFTPQSAGSLPGTLSVSDNAAGSPQTANLTGTGVTQGNYTVASPTAPQTVLPGAKASYTINVSVVPSGDIYNNPVTLTATGLPAGATASFSPVTVTPGTGTATSTMTVQTAAYNALLIPASSTKWPIPSSLALMFGGAWALFRRKHRERFARLLTLMLLLGGLGAATMGLMGCGAGFAKDTLPAAKTYTITVTGTSGEQTQTTTVQLTVE